MFSLTKNLPGAELTGDGSGVFGDKQEACEQLEGHARLCMDLDTQNCGLSLPLSPPPPC